jgi:hypothetical protein
VLVVLGVLVLFEVDVVNVVGVVGAVVVPVACFDPPQAAIASAAINAPES